MFFQPLTAGKILTFPGSQWTDILQNIIITNLWNQFGSAPTASIQKLKSQKKTPEMKRSLGVHSRRAQEHYLIPSTREVIDFQKN